MKSVLMFVEVDDSYYVADDPARYVEQQLGTTVAIDKVFAVEVEEIVEEIARRHFQDISGRDWRKASDDTRAAWSEIITEQVAEVIGAISFLSESRPER